MTFQKPSDAVLKRFLDPLQATELSYTAVGGTFGTPPEGYVVHHTRVLIGHGERTFESARQSLRRWEQFRLGWMEAGPVETPLEVGQIVAIYARFANVWWLNACRIIKVVDESGPVHQFGFAYGSLPVHIGTGEERFVVEWDRADDRVWYDIYSFSKANYLLAKIGYPVFRRVQRQFGRDSAIAMRHAVSTPKPDHVP